MWILLVRLRIRVRNDIIKLLEIKDILKLMEIRVLFD